MAMANRGYPHNSQIMVVLGTKSPSRVCAMWSGNLVCNLECFVGLAIHPVVLDLSYDDSTGGRVTFRVFS